MSADRELLDLAAKAAAAAGAQIIDSVAGPQILHRKTSDGVEHYQQWNPLANDGEALRLAVNLEIEMWFGNGGLNAGGMTMDVEEDYGSDPYAATRRAIVRAAAEIGREMLKGGAT